MKKVILTLVSCAALLSCSSEKKDQAKQEVEVSTAVAVRTEKASTGSVAEIEYYTGIVEPYQLNNIAPTMGLRIAKIHAEVGDMVKKGELLVTMDKNQFIQSQVQLENLKADLARLEEVFKVGGISKQTLDQTRVQVRVMQESTDNLEENIELRSPIDGVVTARNYDAGDIYTMNPNAVLTVMQINPLKVLVDVSEKNFPIIKKGMPITISSEVYPNEVFSGKVSLVYPSINSATHTFTTEVIIPNNDGKLRPGMYSRSTFNLGESEGVMVNDMAVQKQQGSNEKYLFVAVNGKADRRVVQVGRKIDNKFHIISGVEAGEDVIVAGISRLIKGSEIEVKGTSKN